MDVLYVQAKNLSSSDEKNFSSYYRKIPVLQSKNSSFQCRKFLVLTVVQINGICDRKKLYRHGRECVYQKGCVLTTDSDTLTFYR